MRKVLLVALALGFGSSPALAQTAPDPNDERARELYSNGEMLYNEGRYEDAIAAWQEAYRLSEKAPLLFNIADAQEKLGRYQDALDALGRYRAYAPLSDREMLDRRIRNLEARLQEANQAAAPPPTLVEPASAAPVPVPVAQPAPPPPVATPDHPFPVAPVVLFTVGAGGIATGVVFGLQARSARAEAEGLCVATDSGTICPGTAGSALNKDGTDSLIADIGFGVGALALAGGIVTSLLDERGWAVLPGLGGLTVLGRF